jgi:hypothetical protein
MITLLRDITTRHSQEVYGLVNDERLTNQKPNIYSLCDQYYLSFYKPKITKGAPSFHTQ